jgi:hypothetical protein
MIHHYTFGITKYITNNPRENTWERVNIGIIELFRSLGPIIMALLFALVKLFDILHALFYHLALKYVPLRILVQPRFWIAPYFLFFPCAVKMGLRDDKGCIRDHSDRYDRRHKCDRKIRIHFMAPIHGSDIPPEMVKTWIEILKNFGQVLMEPISVTDRAPSQRNLDFLIDSDVVIAEISSPSHEVGYMLRRAEEMNKPILCLIREPKISTMINDYNIHPYNTMIDFKQTVMRFLYVHHFTLPSLKIFLSGPSGASRSNRSIIARELAAHYGLKICNVEEYLRKECRDVQIKHLITEGKLIEPPAMKSIIQTMLEDGRYVLNDYPLTEEDLPNVIDADPHFIFRVAAIKRPDEQKKCSDVEPLTQEQPICRIPILDQQQFPKALIVEIDAEQGSEEALKIIHSTIDAHYLPERIVPCLDRAVISPQSIHGL